MAYAKQQGWYKVLKKTMITPLKKRKNTYKPKGIKVKVKKLKVLKKK